MDQPYSESDPETRLEQAILEMQEDLRQLRQSLTEAICTTKRIEQQYNHAQNEGRKCQRNAQIALRKGDEELARQALKREKCIAKIVNTLKANIDMYSGVVAILKRDLIFLENKISEVKINKNMPKPQDLRMTGAIMEKWPETEDQLRNNRAKAVFERMEGTVLLQEREASRARNEALRDANTVNLESQLAALKSGSVDDELAALKAEMGLETATPQNQTPLIHTVELENLKKQLDQI